MKTISKNLGLILILLISTALATDDILFSSDERVQVEDNDSSDSSGSQTFGFSRARTQDSGSTARRNAIKGSPNQQARSKGISSSGQSARLSANLNDAVAIEALRNVDWINGGGNSRRQTFWTPCFHNPCPKGEFIFCIQTTCNYVIYLTDQNGNVIEQIGRGGWSPRSFRFKADCRRYRIKIVLECGCSCTYLRFNLRQNRDGCFNCPDKVRHYYNPQTCSCQCGNKCGCSRPQTWSTYPTCSCTCPSQRSCDPKNSYWDAKECDCRPLPRCQSCGCDYNDDPGYVSVFAGGN